MALGAITAALAAVQFLPPILPYAAYVNVAIVACGAATTYLHMQGVNGSSVAPPPSN